MRLVQLAPDATDLDAHCLAAQLADILTHDRGLPPDMHPRPDAPPETADSVLAFTKQWCLDRKARFHALVLTDGTVAGGATLGHIDPNRATARVGFFLASPHQTDANEHRSLDLLIGLARQLAITEISTTTPETDQAARSLWERCGLVPWWHDGQLHAKL